MARGNRTRADGVACLLLASLLLGCEAIGAPDAYRTQVCGAVSDLSGPVADAVTALEAAVSTRDANALASQVDALKAAVDRMTTRLVDVPLWTSGADVVKDMRAISAGYVAAIGSLGQAVDSRDQAQVDTAMAGLEAARLAAPGLGDHMRTARLAGLNC